MFAIQCPSCGVSANFSLAEPVYQGPFRCWKCKGVFIVTIENEELKSFELITEEELEKYME